MPRGFLVYNPYSGRFPSGLLAERAANVLRQSGWDIRLLQTRSGKHMTRLAKLAARKRMDALFVVGGDGSINLAVAGLVGTDTALGVLPAGTANVWAQELGLPGLSWTRWLALEESAQRLVTATVHSTDIGQCNNRYFLLWAGIGLDGFVVHHLEPRGRLEKYFALVQYAAGTVWNASLWHGMSLRVETDGTLVSGHFILAAVSNIHLYAGGLAMLSPDARLDDGLMDLWLFKGETLGDTVQRAWDLWAGRHLQSDQVHYIPFRSLTMESDSPLYIQVDGEPVDPSPRVTIQVHPKALRVLVPQKVPHSLFSQSSNFDHAERSH
jgi:YegS/Rv2252/BmrU family lipid kinase